VQARCPMASEWVLACVGLGANLGDPRGQVEAAFRRLAGWPGVRDARLSSLYRTAPVDAAGPDYVNAVAVLDTILSPPALLQALQTIETLHGRERPYPNAPRVLDLDLLLHGDTVLQTPTLTVPHPRLHERAFVLAPLAELAPQLQVPGRGSVAALRDRICDQPIERLSE
jgi:2-amino-4-hydroxy-6-hydroxymethyldihydropteridine diphosphokinase